MAMLRGQGRRWQGLKLAILGSAGALFLSSGESMAMDKVKVAIAQVACVDSDLEGNSSRIARMVERADSAGAALVLFPETVDLGWVNPAAHRLAGPIPGPFSDRICALAARHGIWIGIGLCEKEGERLYDSAILVDDRGRIVLRHRKLNLLAWLMDPPYAPGRVEEIAVAETPFGRFGMLICADSFEEELRQALRGLRPDLVYIPYGWAEEPSAWPEHGFQLIRTVQLAAREIGAPVLGPNLVGSISTGPWTGRTYEGLSTAADARGMSLVQGRWNREDLLVFELEPGFAGPER